MENCSCIVVAGIDGFCIGGGLDLALAADWRIATSHSVFGHPGSDLGLITGFGGTQRLPRLIGAGKACSMLYEARRISCHDAHRAGLVQEIVRQDDFVTNLTERIRRFAGLSPEWISQVKGRFRDHSDGWLGIRRTHVPVG
jgi:enoyl-CoA hydratase/carnithine racemase